MKQTKKHSFLNYQGWVFAMLLTCIVNISCDTSNKQNSVRQEYLTPYDVRFDIVYLQDTIVIKRVTKESTNLDTLVKKEREYYHLYNHQLYLSCVRDTFFQEEFSRLYYSTKINKSNKNGEYYTQHSYVDETGKHHPLIQLTYDKNYHIKEIQTFTNIYRTE